MPGLQRHTGPLPALGAALLLSGLAGCVSQPLRFPEAATVELRRPPAEELAPAWAAGEEAPDGPPLRVLLRRGSQGLRLAAPGGLRLYGPLGSTLAELPAKGKAGLSARDGQLMMNGRGLGSGVALVGPLRRNEAVRVGGRRYRGHLVLKALGGQLALVDVVGLEDYLKGVLPSEVSGLGPIEALKAQAVAARSFAVVQMQESAGKAWDLDNSADSQVYGGVQDETAAADAAVRSTRGAILAFGRAVAHTFFHSNSGGHTADAGEVWASKDPPSYLFGVMDSWSEDQPHYTWSSTIPRAEAEALLHKAGLWDGFLEDVVGRERSESERWIKVDLIGHDGRRFPINANEFRRALGADRVRSTRFKVRLRGDDLVFDGTGWGHGVGLSQEGAFAMARSRRTFRDILYFYYPGTHLASLRE